MTCSCDRDAQKSLLVTEMKIFNGSLQGDYARVVKRVLSNANALQNAGYATLSTQRHCIRNDPVIIQFLSSPNGKGLLKKCSSIYITSSPHPETQLPRPHPKA
jgi:hypothetical protein